MAKRFPVRDRIALGVKLPHEGVFLAAFDDYADALFRHASFRLSNPERAADLTQETFLRVWDYVQNGNTIACWKSFLYRVMNNLIIDEYRRRKEISLDALLEEESKFTNTLLVADSRAEREERFDMDVLMVKIHGLIKELPERQRTALTFRYIDGLSPREIARLLGISENAASVHIHRAVGELKKRFAPVSLQYRPT
jgi:RNA polymerase sigma-70 factor (ECF subfamily)